MRKLRQAAFALTALTTVIASPALAASGSSGDGKAVWATSTTGTTTDSNAKVVALSSSYYVASANGASQSPKTTNGDTATLATGGPNQASGYQRVVYHAAAYTPTGGTICGRTFYDVQNAGGYGAGQSTITYVQPQAYFGALINANVENRSLVFQNHGVTVLQIALNPAAIGTAVTSANRKANYAFHVNATFSGTLFDSVSLNALSLSPGGTASTVSMTNVTTDTVIPSDMPGGNDDRRWRWNPRRRARTDGHRCRRHRAPRHARLPPQERPAATRRLRRR